METTRGAQNDRRRCAAAGAVVAGACLAALLSVGFRPPAAPAPERPDVVLIVIDALRADRLALYGYSRPTTPWLTAHRTGLRWFTDAITESTQTVPAVASLFTAFRRFSTGSPLADAATGRASEPPPEASAVRTIELNNEKAVYEAPWKYIVTKSPFRERLFNLADDPAEKVDRAAAEPGVLARFRAAARRSWPDISYPS